MQELSVGGRTWGTFGSAGELETEAICGPYGEKKYT